MRLINTETLELESFNQDIPEYVILSHTWGTAEVSFSDFLAGKRNEQDRQMLRASKER